MYNSRKVDDALEMCRDIKKYYEKEEKKTPKLEGEPDFSVTMALEDVQKYIREQKEPERNLERKPEKEEISFAASAGMSGQAKAVSRVVKAEGARPAPENSPEAAKDWNMAEGAAAPAGKKLRSLWKTAASFVLCLLIAYGAARFITDYLVQPVLVDGISMQDTLSDHDVLLVSKLSYRLHDPERFDIIIFPYQPSEYFVKRIIGLPGETVQITNNQILINGERLLEGYGSEGEILDGGMAKEPVTLGEDEYFVMGDNRNYSMDSRNTKVGAIKRERLEGKAIFRLFPFQDIRKFF